MSLAGSPRGLVIAGVHSGVGKTTITLGLIAAFKRRGLKVQPFKVGPDFIDPGHHTRVAGCACRNLDGWMLSKEANLAIFDHHAAGADLAVVEGVMGLFDGYDGRSEAGSTAQMAKWLGLPVVLVADARSMARSAAALVHGFATFDPDLTLAGVIFNRIGSPTHLRYLEQALEQSGEATCLGGIPRDRELNIPERHLGLTTAHDHSLTPEYIHHLADLMEKCLNLDALLVKGIGRGGQGPTAPAPSPKPSPPTPYRGLGGEFEGRAGERCSPGPPFNTDLQSLWRQRSGNKVVLYDYGVKFNIIRSLKARGLEVLVVPAATPAADILRLKPAGIVLSNGPGDPAAVTYAIDNVRQCLGHHPMFGICLGHQLMGLGLGGRTFKLKFGHRGANQPVKNKLSGRVEITSQNHGFAVDIESIPDPEVELTHFNLNDGTLEGLRHPKLRAFSVQYHPEASPGPHDADYLFEEFIKLMVK